LALFIIPILLLVAGIDLAARTLFPPDALLPYMQRYLAFYTLKVERFQSKPAPDVLFLGSSRVRDGVVPTIFKEALSRRWGRPAKVYNLGLAGAHTEEIYTLVNSYLPDPSPPYVVIGLSGREAVWIHDFQYASRFLWTLPDIMDYLTRVSFEEFQVKHVEYFIEFSICRLWYLFAHRDELSKMTREWMNHILGVGADSIQARKDALERKRLVKNVNAEDGHSPVLSPFKNLEDRLLKEAGKVQLPPLRGGETVEDFFDESSSKMLGKIIARLLEGGSRVALAETPPSPYLQGHEPMLHGPGLREWMARVAASEGVPFIAFPPEETGLTNAMYGDISHFNSKGAAAYTLQLFERLCEAGFFQEDAK
jgi:hypothetical protein